MEFGSCGIPHRPVESAQLIGKATVFSGILGPHGVRCPLISDLSPQHLCNPWVSFFSSFLPTGNMGSVVYGFQNSEFSKCTRAWTHLLARNTRQACPAFRTSWETPVILRRETPRSLGFPPDFRRHLEHMGHMSDCIFYSLPSGPNIGGGGFSLGPQKPKQRTRNPAKAKLQA